MLVGLETFGGKRNERKRIQDLEKELLRKDKALAEAATLLALKKSPGPLGGRRHDPLVRKQVLLLIKDAMCRGARLEQVAKMLGLTSRTVQRWRDQNGGYDRRNGPRTAPPNQLSHDQLAQVAIDRLACAHFRIVRSSSGITLR